MHVTLPLPNVVPPLPLSQSGFKSETWEGGVRVPAFVHAPGRLPSGEDRTNYVHVTDWVPTLLALAGAPPPPVWMDWMCGPRY